MKSVETRIGELIGSKKYREDFELIRRELSKVAAWAKPGERKPLKGFRFRDDRGRIISGDEMREIFEKGNVNRRRVLVQREHGFYSERYGLRLYLDPARSYPRGFDPFKDPYGSMSVPLDRPIGEILERIRKVRPSTKTRTKKSEHFSEEYRHRMNLLLRKNLTPLEIFHRLHPEHKNWRPKDYGRLPGPDPAVRQVDLRTREDFEIKRRYNRCLLLIRKLENPSR